MAHKAQTRRMANAGKKTGVSSRRSLKPRGAFGKAISGDGSNDPRTGHPKAVQAVEQFWNDLSHQWFGSNPKSFPYNMGKWDESIEEPKEHMNSLITKKSPTKSGLEMNMGKRESNIRRMLKEGELTKTEGKALLKEIKN